MKRLIVTLLICLTLPVIAMDFVVTDNADVLLYKVPFERSNAFKEEIVDILGENVVTLNTKELQEFTYSETIDGSLYIMISGGYDSTCFNSRKYPLTDEIYSWFEGLGVTINMCEYKKIKAERINNEFY